MQKVEIGQKWRHLKRGSFYEIVSLEHVEQPKWESDGISLASSSAWCGRVGRLARVQGQIAAGEMAVFYRAAGGELWARALTEFRDGRFELVTDAASSAEPVAWQWRSRFKGGAWDAWEPGRFGKEVPPFMDVEERQITAPTTSPEPNVTASAPHTVPPFCGEAQNGSPEPDAVREALVAAMPLIEIGLKSEIARFEDMHRPQDHSITAWIGQERVRKIWTDVQAALSRPAHGGWEITEEMVTAAMRAFEPYAGRLLRYPEAERWHMNDVQGMREALRKAFSLARNDRGSEAR